MHIGPLQGNPNKNHLPWQLSATLSISVTKKSQHYAFPKFRHLPSQGHRREPPATSSFLPPAAVLFQLQLHFWTLRNMQMCGLTYPKRKKDWAPWDWRQGEVARHLCAFSQTEMLLGMWERVIWEAKGYKGGMVKWLKKKMHGCTSKTHRTSRKLYFHLSNMAGLYVPAKKREGVCKGERKRGDGVNFVVVGFRKVGGRALKKYFWKKHSSLGIFTLSNEHCSKSCLSY